MCRTNVRSKVDGRAPPKSLDNWRDVLDMKLLNSVHDQALWATGSTVFMELGFGGQLPPGLAGGRKVVSERGAT